MLISGVSLLYVQSKPWMVQTSVGDQDVQMLFPRPNLLLMADFLMPSKDTLILEIFSIRWDSMIKIS